MMLSIICSTSRQLGSQLSSKNSTDCIAAALWCLQWPPKDQDAAEAVAVCPLVRFSTRHHAEQAVALRPAIPPWASVVWAPPERGRRREASVGTRYDFDVGCVTPSTFMLAFSGSKPVLAHKQAEWQQSALWATARYFAFLRRLKGTRSPSSFQGTCKWWAASWLGTTAAEKETLQGSVLFCFILIEKFRANLVSRKLSL